MDNFTVWVNGVMSKLEAFASIYGVPANQFMVSAFILNFLGATSLDYKELGSLPRPPTSILRALRQPMCLLPPNSCSPPHQCPKAAAAMLLLHEHVVPAVVLRTLDRLQPGAGWSMVKLRQQELLHLLAVEYSLTNGTLMTELCHVLLQKSSSLAVQRRRNPTPQTRHPNLGLVC